MERSSMGLVCAAEDGMAESLNCYKGSVAAAAGCERRKHMAYEEVTIEGRNAVIEALRSGRAIDKLYILDGCQDGPVMTVRREAKKRDTMVKYVTRERLDQMSDTGRHQGVIAVAAAYEYAEVEDLLAAAREKGEPPFLFLLDNIEDPHNLGAIIRTANLAGAHRSEERRVGKECYS